MFDTGRTITAGDAALFVAETGVPEGEPIVLLHGGLGSRTDFAALAARLGCDHRLVAIDSRGHGRSALGGERLSYRRLAQDVAAVLAALGLTQAGIIGHSDGGIVALRLATAETQPRFLVTVGAHWQLAEDDPTRDLYRKISEAQWREMFPAGVARYEAENPAPDFARLFEATRAMWLGNGPDAYPGETVRAIRAPLLVVHGDEDALVSRAQAAGLAERVPGARLLNLPFATHTVLQDDPDAVAPALRDFVAGAGRGAPG
ncbi:alpha/beta hydrolase [Bosea sp. TWI1241]|uniref:alpha/beta fold hydrolase n=1 Tax=Bosea sp. TWI1241 TaxID=3148904 RepID=UPI00320B1C21